jgi:plastocyanin
MTRRTAVAALATVAAFGVAAAPAAAAKKNEIRIVGGAKFKAGKFLKIDLRFKPTAISVKSGATVKVVDKTSEPEPHTISFAKKSALPKGFDFEGGPVFTTLLTAHQADPETGDVGFFQVDDGVGVPNDEAGVLEVDSLGDATNAGDSQFFLPGEGTSFKVTAKKGSTLPYYCAIHTWMQGKIKVN